MLLVLGVAFLAASARAQAVNVSLEEPEVLEDGRIMWTGATAGASTWAVVPNLFTTSRVAVTCSAARSGEREPLVFVERDREGLRRAALGDERAPCYHGDWSGGAFLPETRKGGPAAPGGGASPTGLAHPRGRTAAASTCVVSVPTVGRVLVGVAGERPGKWSLLLGKGGALDPADPDRPPGAGCWATRRDELAAGRLAAAAGAALIFWHARSLSRATGFRLALGGAAFSLLSVGVLLFFAFRLLPARRGLLASLAVVSGSLAGAARLFSRATAPTLLELLRSPWGAGYIALSLLVGAGVSYWYNDSRSRKTAVLLAAALRLAGLGGVALSATSWLGAGVATAALLAGRIGADLSASRAPAASRAGRSALGDAPPGAGDGSRRQGPHDARDSGLDPLPTRTRPGSSRDPRDGPRWDPRAHPGPADLRRAPEGGGRRGGWWAWGWRRGRDERYERDGWGGGPNFEERPDGRHREGPERYGRRRGDFGGYDAPRRVRGELSDSYGGRGVPGDGYGDRGAPGNGYGGRGGLGGSYRGGRGAPVDRRWSADLKPSRPERLGDGGGGWDLRWSEDPRGPPEGFEEGPPLSAVWSCDHGDGRENDGTTSWERGGRGAERDGPRGPPGRSARAWGAAAPPDEGPMPARGGVSAQFSGALAWLGLGGRAARAGEVGRRREPDERLGWRPSASQRRAELSDEHPASSATGEGPAWLRSRSGGGAGVKGGRRGRERRRETQREPELERRESEREREPLGLYEGTPAETDALRPAPSSIESSSSAAESEPTNSRLNALASQILRAGRGGKKRGDPVPEGGAGEGDGLRIGDGDGDVGAAPRRGLPRGLAAVRSGPLGASPPPLSSGRRASVTSLATPPPSPAAPAGPPLASGPSASGAAVASERRSRRPALALTPAAPPLRSPAPSVPPISPLIARGIILNAETNHLIGIGKGTYNRLLAQGYVVDEAAGIISKPPAPG